MSVTRYRRNERGLVKSDSGYLVAYDDYSELEAERDRLQKQINTARQIIPSRYEYLSPAKKARIIQQVLAVLGAVQEDNDEIPRTMVRE